MLTLPRRLLGRTRIEVSLLGLGTVKFGRNRDFLYPKPFEVPDDATVARLLDRARELGVNLIDTAPAYGDSEVRLGRLLERTRSQWVICTKAGEEWSGGESRFDFSPEHIDRSVQRSLERLRTDYIDVVLLHSHGDDLAILEQRGTLGVLADLKRRGSVRAYGISHKTVEGGLLAAGTCDVVMTPPLVDDLDRHPVIAAAAEHGCGVLVKKALRSGHLRDPSAALRRVAAIPGVSSIVVGTIDAEHLAANVQALARSE